MQHPCKDQPSIVPAAWNIHPSHKMLNLGVGVFDLRETPEACFRRSRQAIERALQGTTQKIRPSCEAGPCQPTDLNPQARCCTRQDPGTSCLVALFSYTWNNTHPIQLIYGETTCWVKIAPGLWLFLSGRRCLPVPEHKQQRCTPNKLARKQASIFDDSA